MTPPRGHSYTIGEPRALSSAEKALLAAMLDANEATRPFLTALDEYRVQAMNDGGMGSLRVVGSPDRRFGSISMEASFLDEDGTPVLVAAILDQRGELYELDVWKVDGNPLGRIPSVKEIEIGRGNGRAS